MKINTYLTALLLLLGTGMLKAQSPQQGFEEALAELKSMLEGRQPAHFERAVFISENPYWNNRCDYGSYQGLLDYHQHRVQQLIAANDKSGEKDFRLRKRKRGGFALQDLEHSPAERRQLYRKALANWAIFTYMTEETAFGGIWHPAFQYAAKDPFGKTDWSHAQVLGLLTSKGYEGNCYAHASLFKILSDRLDAGARLCTAPQHIYIQHPDPQGDGYNVELATAGHPSDGAIQTLTYSTNKAIEKGIALRRFDDRQAIGLCLINLAKGYERAFGTSTDGFAQRCANLALAYDSLNLNALLLKQQILDKEVLAHAQRLKTDNPGRLRKDQQAAASLQALTAHLARLHRLGYRPMPLDMQESLLYGFAEKAHAKPAAQSQNASPFTTIKPLNPEDNEYVGLSGGTFQEVFALKPVEQYGHFTYSAIKEAITRIDTSKATGQLIDPVAFAYDLGARMYDVRLGRFIAVDPLAGVEPGWSPYRAFYNNPIYFVDPTGMLETDYYDQNTGEHLGHVDDGIDEAVAISRSTFDALRNDGEVKNDAAKALGEVSLGSNSTFEKIAATLYAEAGYRKPSAAESAGIYDVLENRSEVSSKTPMELIESGGIYGYGDAQYKIALAKGEGYKPQDYSENRHNAARKGAILGISNANDLVDFSKGAYFWDAAVFLDNPKKFSRNMFNVHGHGSLTDPKSKNFTFIYTTKVGATYFMKYNPSLFPNKTWP